MALDVIAAGELYIDLIMSGFDHLPLPGEEAFARDFGREPGGGAAITALGLARLGTRAGVVGAVGAGDGGWLIDQLDRGGVDTAGIRSVENEFTGTTVAASGPAERAFLTYAGANRIFSYIARETPLEARHVHWAAPPDVEAFSQLRLRGMSISLDVGFLYADARCLHALPLVDLFFPNELEAGRITGLREPEAMLRALGPGAVLKLGARGAAMLVEDRLLMLEPPPVAAVDTTGAGDCFDAGFLHAWLRGGTPEECLRLGNLCGAFSTRALGGVAAFPTLEEISCPVK